MQRYEITGMSCAACASHVEKAVSAVPGVAGVAVSLLTNSMQVDYTPDADPDTTAKRICNAVEAAGYGASLATAESENAELEDTETPKLKKRLIASLCFLVPLMYVSMGHMIGLPLPSFMEGHGSGAMVFALVQLVLTLPVCWINRAFFISGWKGIKSRAPGMDALVSMGAGAALLYGLYAIVMIGIGLKNDDMELIMQYRHDLYFESAATILTLITVGKTLEAYSKGKTTDALKSLMKLAPQTACVLRDSEQVMLPVSEVQVGDLFLVRPGESIPVDGTVTEGISSVNEAALTGESMPVDKFPGSPVSAATINQNGALTCRAERVGQDTTLSQVIRLVRDAAATKAPLAKTADKVSGIFVPAVTCIALLTFVIWLLLGQTFTYALARGISVLVISCPCALGLATPVAIMVGNGVGAKNGILFKTAVSLEQTGKTEIVALDKTGTITSGEPRVTDILPADGVTEQVLMSLAAALEQKSEHPLARAVLQKAQEDNLTPAEVADFQALPGNGLTAVLNGSTLYGGNAKLMQTLGVAVPQKMASSAEALAAQGKTPLFFAKDGTMQGVIAVADVIKEDSPQAVRELQGMGIRVVMLTGDNERTARAIGAQAGVDDVIAGVLPDGKESVIRSLREQGKVAMVGDGINDAPAIKHADMGIAMGIAGTDVTKEASDMVLLDDSFSTIIKAVQWGRGIYENFKRFIQFQLTVNVSSVVVVIASILAGFPAPFTALELLWINIIMDGPPALTLGLEPIRENLLKHPPTKRNANIISRKMLIRIFANGIFISIVFMLQHFTNFLGATQKEEATVLFTLFVLFQLFNAFNCRELDDTPMFKNLLNNKLMLGVFLIVLVLQFLITQVGTAVFETTPLSAAMWGKMLLTAGSVVVINEIWKGLAYVFSSLQDQNRN